MSAQEFRQAIARWVGERLAPQAEALDRSGEFPREPFKEAGKLGFIGVMYPEKYGGYGLMSEFAVQRCLRDSYFPMIGGGTSDIMRLVVARQLGLRHEDRW